jgi:hypothetical protein
MSKFPLGRFRRLSCLIWWMTLQLNSDPGLSRPNLHDWWGGCIDSWQGHLCAWMDQWGESCFKRLLITVLIFQPLLPARLCVEHLSTHYLIDHSQWHSKWVSLSSFLWGESKAHRGLMMCLRSNTFWVVEPGFGDKYIRAQVQIIYPPPVDCFHHQLSQPELLYKQ